MVELSDIKDKYPEVYNAIYRQGQDDAKIENILKDQQNGSRTEIEQSNDIPVDVRFAQKMSVYLNQGHSVKISIRKAAEEDPDLYREYCNSFFERCE
jgi:hypothetical protein